MIKCLLNVEIMVSFLTRTTTSCLSMNICLNEYIRIVSVFVLYSFYLHFNLGTPAEVYVYGIQIIIETFGWFISYVLTLGMVVALIHPLKLTSAYEVHLQISPLTINNVVYLQ
jgi:hypothetical protein